MIPGVEFAPQNAVEMLVLPPPINEPIFALRPFAGEARFLVCALSAGVLREDFEPDPVRGAVIEEPLEQERDRLRTVACIPRIALADQDAELCLPLGEREPFILDAPDRPARFIADAKVAVLAELREAAVRRGVVLERVDGQDQVAVVPFGGSIVLPVSTALRITVSRNGNFRVY